MNPVAVNADDPPWPSQPYAWYVVGVLFLGSIFSFLDRQVIALMVDHIKADLGLNDFEIGLLQGPPFGIFYATMSIPLALLADRRNRRNIIIAGVTFWSLATAACGLAGNFVQLFLARIGVGSGEACLAPCAYSMISDYFRRHLLPLAMAIFTMGNLAGVGLAMIIGGAVLAYAESLGEIVVWGLGEIKPWQLTFIVIGLPGLLLALLLLTVKEPLRRGARQDKDSTSIRAFMKFLGEHRRTFACLFGSFTMLVMVAYGNFAWVPTFFIRTFGWTPAEAGSVYGTLVAVFGTGGALFGGAFASWLARRGHTDAPYRATLLCSVPLLPLALLIYWVAPDGRWAAALYAPYQFLSAVPAGLAPAAMMSLTPNEMRAKISSAYLFFSNFIGLSLGAALVGFITHNVLGDDARVGDSLAIVNILGIPLAVVIIGLGMASFRDGVRRAPVIRIRAMSVLL
ncbi:MAG: MFS transporter [Pseudomonadales bacterium]